MFLKKKQNLLIYEYKHKYINSKIKNLVIGYVIIVVACGGVLFIRNTHLKKQVAYLKEKTDAYIEVEKKVTELQNSISQRHSEILSLNEKYFPFSDFINFMYQVKPNDLAILTVETDSIVREVEEKIKQAEEEAKAKEEAEKSTADTESSSSDEVIIIGGDSSQSSSETNGESSETTDSEGTVDDSGQFLTTIDTSELNESFSKDDYGNELTFEELEKKKEETIEKVEKNKEFKTLKYESDLKGSSIRITGYSESEKVVSEFISSLKAGGSSYILSLSINGIEEKDLDSNIENEDENKVILFELLINLKSEVTLNAIN